MKTKNLLILLLFAVQLVNGQTFDKKSSWVEVRTSLFDETVFELTTYKVGGDTLINSKYMTSIGILTRSYISRERIVLVVKQHSKSKILQQEFICMLPF